MHSSGSLELELKKEEKPKGGTEVSKQPSTPQQRADALLNDVEMWAAIEATWWQTMSPDSTEPPPDGSAAYHAQRLLDLLEERMTEQAASAEEHYILDQHRMEPYDSTRNAVQVMRHNGKRGKRAAA